MKDDPSKSALPLYVQIAEVLIREIGSGHLIDGQCLPPERDLAKQYNTTVRTLRKSLKLLEEKGLLKRIQGSGNYIQTGGDTSSIYSMFRLELPDGGGLPTAKVLSVRELKKPPFLPRFGSLSKATRVRRIRYLNRQAVAVEEIWLDSDAGQIIPEKLGDSMYLYYKQQLGFWIDYAEDFVSVSPAPEWSPSEFTPISRMPVGLVERFSHAGAKGVVEYSRTWFDPQKARYVQRLK